MVLCCSVCGCVTHTHVPKWHQLGTPPTSVHHSQPLNLAILTSPITNPSTLSSNTPLKPTRDINSQDTILDCTLKYKPRNPRWENTWTKNHHHCALIQYKPHNILIGKTWENSQKKTISLPPYLCKQVEVWIHYKSIIVLSYHSAWKHMMESHQNEFRLLEGRSKHFHSHS